MTKRKQHSETQHVGIRVPTEQIERLRAVAEADHRTVSQELRRLIAQRIAEGEQGKAA